MLASPLQLAAALEDVLGVPAELQRSGQSIAVDAVVRAGDWRFVIDYRPMPVPSQLRDADARSRAAAASLAAVPLIAVPFMSEGGAEACTKLGASWFDLAGNARINGDGLLVRIEGRPAPTRPRGRPASVFAPRGARLARALLDRPAVAVRQLDLVRDTGLSEGFVSKVVRRLLDDRLLSRSSDGLIRVADPDALLDAWAADYDFDKHTIVAGHVVARRGTELIDVLDRALSAAGRLHAFSALPAAWLMSRHADFRLATVYVDEIDDSVLQKLHFRDEARGANVQLVVPNDVDILQRRHIIDGRPCVTAAQTWLDLQQQPERAPEAAAELRARHMPWSPQ